MKKTNFKEELIMIKNKEKIVQQAENINEELTELVYQIQQLDAHEFGALNNVLNEIGLPDIEELEWQFGRLAEMADKVEIIEGYQVWIDCYKDLNIIINNKHKKISGDLDLENLFENIIYDIGENRQAAKNIFKWYFEQVY
jgi:hypothetical protein